MGSLLNNEALHFSFFLSFYNSIINVRLRKLFGRRDSPNDIIMNGEPGKLSVSLLYTSQLVTAVVIHTVCAIIHTTDVCTVCLCVYDGSLHRKQSFFKKKTNLCSAFNSVEEVAPISNKLVHSQVVPYFHFLSPSYLYT